MTSTAATNPEITMDTVRQRIGKVIALLGQMEAEHSEAASKVAAKRSGSSAGGEAT